MVIFEGTDALIEVVVRLLARVDFVTRQSASMHLQVSEAPIASRMSPLAIYPSHLVLTFGIPRDLRMT